MQDHSTKYDLARRAAQWGADQELEACVDWLHWQNLATHPDLIPFLRAARRPKPKPKSLAEEAYIAFVQICKGNSDDAGTYDADEALVRRALERLQELEGGNG